MEAVTSLISAGADVNDVDDEVRHSVSPHTWSDGLVCDVISVSLHMSVITQWAYSPLIQAAWNDKAEVVSLLVKTGAALDLQNEVNM